MEAHKFSYYPPSTENFTQANLDIAAARSDRNAERLREICIALGQASELTVEPIDYITYSDIIDRCAALATEIEHARLWAA